MTLKEYIVKKHPEAINDRWEVGIAGCPEYYEELSHIKTNCDNECDRCWNREYIPQKTYEDGLRDAWEFAQFIIKEEADGGMPYKVFIKAYDELDSEQVIAKFDYEEARSRYDKYKCYQVGDEVELNSGETGWVINTDFVFNCIFVLGADSTMHIWNKNYIKKTGRRSQKLAEAIQEVSAK